MTKLLSILGLMFLVSCGGNFDHMTSDDMDGTGDTDPTLSRFLESFESDMNVTIPSHLSINVVDELKDISNPNVDAVCWSSRSSGRGERIEIRRSRWNVLTEAGKEQLLYHELGHCVLNKGHTEGHDNVSSCPLSVMNPYTFSEWQIKDCYIPYHDGYITELRR